MEAERGQWIPSILPRASLLLTDWLDEQLDVCRTGDGRVTPGEKLGHGMAVSRQLRS